MVDSNHNYLCLVLFGLVWSSNGYRYRLIEWEHSYTHIYVQRKPYTHTHTNTHTYIDRERRNENLTVNMFNGISIRYMLFNAKIWFISNYLITIIIKNFKVLLNFFIVTFLSVIIVIWFHVGLFKGIDICRASNPMEECDTRSSFMWVKVQDRSPDTPDGHN